MHILNLFMYIAHAPQDPVIASTSLPESMSYSSIGLAVLQAVKVLRGISSEPSNSPSCHRLLHMVQDSADGNGLMRHENEMYVLRHDHISPKIKSALGSGTSQRRSEPHDAAILGQQRLAAKAREGQAMGLVILIISFAQLAVDSPADSHGGRF